jgi:hypothetical protein
MTRRELFVNSARLCLLNWRLVRGRALPAFVMAVLRTLDRWAAERAIDEPWTREASARVDRVVSRDGDR